MAEPTLPQSQPEIQLPGAARDIAFAPFARLGDGAAAFVLLLAIAAATRGLLRGAMLAGRGLVSDPGGAGRAWRLWSQMKGAAMQDEKIESDLLISEIGIEDAPPPVDAQGLYPEAMQIYQQVRALRAGRVVKIACPPGHAESYAQDLRAIFVRVLGSRVIRLDVRTADVVIATRGVNWR